MKKATKQEKKVILIDKTGTTKEIGITDPTTLFKKAGFKTGDGFDEIFVWEIVWEDVKYTISLFAKKTGRVPKNAYGFPPPLEDASFYGNCILMCHEHDLTVKIWDNLFESIYEKYDEDDDESAEEEEDDYEAVDEGEDDVEEEEVEEEGEKPAHVRKKAANGKSKKKDELVPLFIEAPISDTFLDCSEELELEPYV